MNDKIWEIFDKVAPILLILLVCLVPILAACALVAINKPPKPMVLDERYNFNIKVVEDHNILVISRNNSTQFEAIDLGQVQLEEK